MTEDKYCPVTGKVCYTISRASEVIHLFKKHRRNVGKFIPTRSYMCKFCGAYHLTHFKKKRTDKQKRIKQSKMYK